MPRPTLRPPLALVLLLAVLPAAAPAAPAPEFGRVGLDLDGRDPAVRPGTDFFRYAGGRWLAATRIPADRTTYGTSTVLAERAEAQLRAILDEAAAGTAAPGTVARQIGDYYAAFLDRAAIDARGLAPATPALEAIAAAQSHEDVARLIARPDLDVPGPIDFAVTLDQKNPDRYVLAVSIGGLALPDRDFYLRDDGGFPALREAYRAHIERFLGLVGDAGAADAARAILALETEIARLHWPRAERRDRDRTYNLTTRPALEALAPDYPWDAAFTAAGLAVPAEVVVRESTAIGPLAHLFRTTPLDTWRKYLRYHYLRRNASVLPAALDEEAFAFFGRTLNGQPEQRERWKRAVDATNGALGEAVGQIYVARHFPPEAKAAALALVENMRRAYAARIAGLTWLTPATKRLALEKLAAIRPKIGYPDRWRDYGPLEVRRDDAFGNRTRAGVFEWRRDVERLGRPTDRDEWFLTPQTVNAYYNAVFNEIVFPAAILQAPYFDPHADAAVNYGAIGAVIGHEMGHGFDDQGSKSDARGVLRSWWTEEDAARFKARTAALADQYDAFAPLPGIHVNGRLTLGENIGDLGGLSVALDAYRLSLRGHKAPVLEGLTAPQRFFLAYAQMYRRLYRDEALRNLILSDPHSPSAYRVNGVVRNVDAWYEAFGVAPGDPLYLEPAKRVRIW